MSLYVEGISISIMKANTSSIVVLFIECLSLLGFLIIYLDRVFLIGLELIIGMFLIGVAYRYSDTIGIYNRIGMLRGILSGIPNL